MVREFWKHADAGLAGEFARMHEGFRFYTGDQWDLADLEKLQAEKRPALTINLILPIVNLLSGIQRQGRQDVTVVARKGGFKALASVYTQVLRHCLDMADADYEIADCFLDGIIGGKGWLQTEIDYSDDPVSGDLVVRKVSPFAIREDPDATEYDLNKSGKFVIHDTWMDRDALLLNYPAKQADIEAGGLEIDPASGDVAGDASVSADASTRSNAHLRYRVRECWWKAYQKRLVLINTVTGAMKTVLPAQQELASAVAANSKHWVVKDWVVPVLHKTVTAGNLVLADSEDPYHGVVRFPYTRFCPFWTDGYVMGVVQNLTGPQQEVNKRRSQALHNLNQTANSGFKVKKVLNNYDRHLAKFGSTPGVVLDESKAGGSIERIEPAPLSAGHTASAQLSADDMKEISGANHNLMGQVTENFAESGKAIELRQAQGMKVVEVVFDNFARTQKLMATGLVEMIRFTEVYSDDEIKAILSDGPDGRSQKSEDRNQNKNILALLKNRMVGKYGITVQSSSSSPTQRYANFMNVLEIARMYPERVPAEAVIERSDVADKEKLMEQLTAAPGIQGDRNAGMQGGKNVSIQGKRKIQMSRDFVNTLKSGS
jgi:hypothetical protein